MAEPLEAALSEETAIVPEGDDVDDMQAAKETAAADMIDAMNAGDAASLTDAFQRMYDACAMGGVGEY